MKIICVEEHTTDPAIAKASEASVMAIGSYMKDVGGEPAEVTRDLGRPQPVLMKKALELAPDLGAGRLAAMDAHGIDMQVLSYSSQTQLAPADKAAGLARAANDRLAAAVRAEPSRFRAFATLPWQVPEAAAEELERAVKELGLVGTLLVGRPGETFLDDDRYRPVLAKLDELRVPIYLHPGIPLPQVQAACYAGLGSLVSARLSLFAWGWHNEAGIHVIRLLLSGAFDRYRNLQVISGHWGEMVPFFLQRMDDSLPPAATGLSRSIIETYREHVYVSPSGMLTRPHFDFIYQVLGADRLLYSVDYPYLTMTAARQFLEGLPISQEEKEKFAYKNAEKLFRM